MQMRFVHVNSLFPASHSEVVLVSSSASFASDSESGSEASKSGRSLHHSLTICVVNSSIFLWPSLPKWLQLPFVFALGVVAFCLGGDCSLCCCCIANYSGRGVAMGKFAAHLLCPLLLLQWLLPLRSFAYPAHELRRGCSQTKAADRMENSA